MGSCQNTFLSFFETKMLKVERPLNIVLHTSIVGAFFLGVRPQQVAVADSDGQRGRNGGGVTFLVIFFLIFNHYYLM
jgi:hypothetical protein